MSRDPLDPACEQARGELLALGGDELRLEAELRRHVEACAACAAAAAGARRLAAALRELPRRAVPAELAGRVVASSQAGFREERAVRALGRLARAEAPGVLEQTLSSFAPRASAPGVLARLVDEDLRDPQRALARRFAGRLRRLRAPEELERRVAAALLAGPARPRWRPLAIAAGALLLAGGSVAALLWSSGRKPAARTYSFEVVYVESLPELAGPERYLLAGVSGGWTEAVAGSASPVRDEHPERRDREEEPR